MIKVSLAGIKEDLKSVACFGITPQILTSGSNGNCKAGNLTKFWPLLAELAASASVEVLVSLALSLAPAESANKVWSFSIFLLLKVKYLNYLILFYQFWNSFQNYYARDTVFGFLVKVHRYIGHKILRNLPLTMTGTT